MFSFNGTYCSYAGWSYILVCLKTRNLPKWPKWWMKYGKTYWKIMNQWGSINLGLAYLQTNPAVYSLVDQGIEVTRAVVSEVSDLMTSLLVWMMILQAAKIFGWWMVTIQLDGVAYTVFLVYIHSIFSWALAKWPMGWTISTAENSPATNSEFYCFMSMSTFDSSNTPWSVIWCMST